GRRQDHARTGAGEVRHDRDRLRRGSGRLQDRAHRDRLNRPGRTRPGATRRAGQGDSLSPAPRGGIFYGWWMVAACLLIATLAWTLGVFGVSAYLYAITRLQGWSIGVVSSSITMFYLTSACLSIPVGSLVGRKGPRGVFTIGALAMGTSVILLGRVTAPWRGCAVWPCSRPAWRRSAPHAQRYAPDGR